MFVEGTTQMWGTLPPDWGHCPWTPSRHDPSWHSYSPSQLERSYDLAVVGRLDALGYAGLHGPWCIEALRDRVITLLREPADAVGKSNFDIEDRIFPLVRCCACCRTCATRAATR